VDWTTSKLIHFNQLMPCESCLLNLISGSARIVGSKIIYLSSEYYTTGIISIVYRFFWHLSHLRHTSILNYCTLCTWKVTDYSARRTQVIGGGIPKNSFVPGQRLYQLFVHPTRLSWPTFRAISMPGCCISQFVIFEMISSGHLTSVPGLSFG